MDNVRAEERKSELTGMPVNLIQGVAYVLSSMLAAFGGIMISEQVNGAFLGLGEPYLLQTVGSAVVGGTLIFGGRAVPLGTLLGNLFLVLLVTAMQVAGLKIGGQLVLTQQPADASRAYFRRERPELALTLSDA